MPDRRFYSLRSKKPCRCHHGSNIHLPKRTAAGLTYPCGHPGCKCTDYRPEKQKCTDRGSAKLGTVVLAPINRAIQELHAQAKAIFRLWQTINDSSDLWKLPD
jgi:hypothetical protein